VNQLELQPLELLDLSACATVSDIVAAMSRCSFGARMLGETAATLTAWIAAGRAPLCIYDGRSDTPLGQLLQAMIRRKWLLGLMTPGEYARTIAPGGRLLVVGAFSERDEQALFERPEQAIYINPYDLAKPGQVRDGWYPDAVFSDPRFVMPVLNRVLEDRLGSGRPGKISDLIANLAPYGGLAAEVAAGARTFKAMVEDKDCFVFFTMSGAMTIAKMGLVVCDMIDHGMVQALASTGALMAHGLVESVGLKHYKYDPAKGDAELARARLNRVTDTLEPETNLDHIEGVLDDLLNGLEAGRPFSPVILNRLVGEHLAAKYPNDRGILKSAFLKNVPVMVPAFVDSEIGNDVHVHNRKRERDGRPQLVMDMELDTRLLVDLATTGKRAGIFTVGGGVPRNNVQNVAPLVEIMNERMGWSLPDCKFRYGCRICPDRMHYGHLSGCTYSEGMSWRKFDPAGMFAEVHADATQVWPFYVKYVLE
jgi:deoxyhypusine synthase